ncbi:putative membrane protein [Secundilactobacillus oryzae JCM 18671]|uniref:Putative membrane protein n=1 Tax=Secundilactobacillus oryzae JCM 18671 TaxID=1291743 RepID=A0A081BHH4_9LACO|nr:putative membrane protein [Secundilactobacillus oryzae JCM 18671]
MFAAKRVTPFGSNNLLFSDIGAQYLPFLSAFRHAILTHNFHLFSFQIALGDNITPLLGYYLLSPFNLIVLLFPKAMLPTAMSVIIILKIASIGLAMSIFLRRVYHTIDYTIVWFSTAFSLCGFVAMNFFTLMWLDALILLPLVALGIHRLYNVHKFDLYIVTLLLSIITNYYLGYMTCLFSVLYFFYLIFKNSEAKLLPTLKTAAIKIRDFFFASIITGGLSAILLVPTFQAMLTTGKGAFKLSSFLPLPTFGFGAFTQFEVASGNYLDRIFHYPSLYVGLLMLLLLVTYYYTEEIPQHYKNMSVWLLGILFLGMWLRSFNTVWHMMQQPAGFPFRNVYFFSFVCIILAFEAWQTHPGKVLNDLQKLAVIATTIGLLLLGRLGFFLDAALVGHKYEAFIKGLIPPFEFFAISCLIVLLEAIFLFAKRQTIFSLGVISLILIAELSGNFFKAMYGIPFGSQPRFSRDLKIEQRQIDRITQTDHSFYRIDNHSTIIADSVGSRYNSYNDSLLFNYNDLTSYSSTLDNQTRVMLRDLGLFSKNERRISSQGISPLVETLAATKYTNHPHRNQPSLKSSYVGIGFAIPKAAAEFKLSPFDIEYNQQTLLNLMGAPTNTIHPVSELTHDVDPDSQFPKLVHHTLKFKAPATGRLYGSGNRIIYESFKVNGISRRPRFQFEHERFLINLGTHKRGDSISVDFLAEPTLSNQGSDFFAYDATHYHQFIKTLKAHKFRLDPDSTATRLHGTVTGSRKNRLLFMSVPNQTGWSAQVNDRSVPIRAVADHFMGIPLKPGKNHVNLTYHVPGFFAGELISAVSFGLLVLFGWRMRHFRKTK